MPWREREREREKQMPLTNKVKMILEGKLFVESKTDKKKLRVKSEDRWHAQKNAESTAKNALEDLIFLAKNNPELINSGGLIELVKTIIEQDKIEGWERHVNRLPAEFGGLSGTNGKGYMQIGDLKTKYGENKWRHGSSVPLKKLALDDKIYFVHKLLQAIFDELASVNGLFSSKRIRVIKIKVKNGKHSLESSLKLEVKSEKRAVSPEVTETMYHAELPLKSADPEKVTVIVLEKQD